MALLLPGADPDPTARATALAKSRETYRFDRSIGDYPLTEGVPKGEGYSIAYMAKAAGVEAALLENRWKASRDERLAGERAEYASILDHDLPKGLLGELEKVKRATSDARERGLYRAPLVQADALDDYAALLQSLPTPMSQAHHGGDDFFAWQRIAGCNPAYLRVHRTVDDRIALDQATFERAVGTQEGSLEAAMEEGRVFLLDHTNLAGLSTRPSYGFPRYLSAPLAVFLRASTGRLAPVAIAERAGGPVLTPADRERWTLARNAIQAADAANQGISEHLGMCHIFANGVGLCVARTLAPNHPIRWILWPHFEMTFAANDTMKTAVIGEGGFVDRLQGPALDAAITLAGRALRERSVTDSSPFADFALRGVDDTEALPEYPYRDDALPVARALRDWVSSYVGLFYDDASVDADPELAAFWALLASPDGAGLSGLPTRDRAGLIELITTVIFRITGYHNVINYGGYDFYAYAPNLPTSRWAPLPDTDATVTEADLLAQLPPLGLADLTLDLMMPQRQLRLNTLGDYPRCPDARVGPLVEDLEKALASVETTTAARDSQRRYAFPYLLPSEIAQSIHV